MRGAQWNVSIVLHLRAMRCTYACCISRTRAGLFNGGNGVVPSMSSQRSAVTWLTKSNLIRRIQARHQGASQSHFGGLESGLFSSNRQTVWSCAEKLIRSTQASC
jgi:hypothetical protein